MVTGACPGREWHSGPYGLGNCYLVEYEGYGTWSSELLYCTAKDSLPVDILTEIENDYLTNEAVNAIPGETFYQIILLFKPFNNM